MREESDSSLSGSPSARLAGLPVKGTLTQLKSAG